VICKADHFDFKPVTENIRIFRSRMLRIIQVVRSFCASPPKKEKR